MRVIAGKYKGRVIFSIKGKAFRPTLDRVKEALFSTLGSEVHGCVLGDFFAGSGNVGIEALSRGAKKVVFVESSKERRELIKKNCSAILSSEDKKNWKLFNDVSFFSKAPENKGIFDILFCDPPYDYFAELMEHDAEKDVIEDTCKLVKTGGIFVLEAPDFFYLKLKDNNILPEKVRKYGHIYMLYYGQ